MDRLKRGIMLLPIILYGCDAKWDKDISHMYEGPLLKRDEVAVVVSTEYEIPLGFEIIGYILSEMTGTLKHEYEAKTSIDCVDRKPLPKGDEKGVAVKPGIHVIRATYSRLIEQLYADHYSACLSFVAEVDKIYAVHARYDTGGRSAYLWIDEVADLTSREAKRRVTTEVRVPEDGGTQKVKKCGEEPI